MLSPKPQSKSGDEVPTSPGKESYPSKLHGQILDEQMHSTSTSPKKLQVRIIRERAAEVPPPPAAAAEGLLTRLTIDVRHLGVLLEHGARHQYTVLSEDSDPAPLTFPAGAERKVVPKEECGRHYIQFAKTGDCVTKTWICGVCGKQCKKQFTLMHHVMVDHLSVRPFNCDSCSKTFKTRCVLTQHANSAHSQLKPYVCTACEKRFARVSVLIQHQRLHTDEKSFICHCGKTFHQRVNLTMHQQRVHRPPSAESHRCRQPPPLVYNCLACSAQLTSVQLLLQHKLTCRPLLESLRSSIKVSPDTETCLDAGSRHSVNHKLLTKIQSIVQQQERLRLRRRRRCQASQSLDPDRLQRLVAAAFGGGTTPPPPPPPASGPETSHTVTPAGHNHRQRQQEEVEEAEESPLAQPATSKMMGILTAPIRTRSMQLARQRSLQPFVLLQTDGEVPTLAKVLRASDGLELLVPATTDDLRQLSPQQSDGRPLSDKLELPVVAIVTRFCDETGAQHVRVQPPSSERPNDCATLTTSRLEPTPTAGVPADGHDPSSPGDGQRRRVPSPSPAAEAEDGPGLSMPSGVDLVAAGPPVRLAPARGDLPPAASLPAAGQLDGPPVVVGPAGQGRFPSVEALPVPPSGRLPVQGPAPALIPAGVGALTERATGLPQGTDILVAGPGVLTETADVLPEGVSILTEGAHVLQGGVDILAEGVNVLPEGANILVGGTDVLSGVGPLFPEGANATPFEASLLSAGCDTMVQFLRQTLAGELEPVSAADAALLFGQPGTSYQILSGPAQ